MAAAAAAARRDTGPGTSIRGARGGVPARPLPPRAFLVGPLERARLKRGPSAGPCHPLGRLLSGAPGRAGSPAGLLRAGRLTCLSAKPSGQGETPEGPPSAAASSLRANHRRRRASRFSPIGGRRRRRRAGPLTSFGTGAEGVCRTRSRRRRWRRLARPPSTLPLPWGEGSTRARAPPGRKAPFCTVSLCRSSSPSLGASVQTRPAPPRRHLAGQAWQRLNLGDGTRFTFPSAAASVG